MRTYAVTGTASGLGAATRRRLEQDGHRVIGVDLAGAEVTADLATAEGRDAMVEQVGELCAGSLNGVVACAGVGGSAGDIGKMVRINYFGAVATLEGLRPLLAAGAQPRAAVIASAALIHAERGNALADACLAGDEEVAVAAGGEDGLAAYSAAKRAVARYVRRAAPTEAWAGSGIPLNAVAPGVIETPMTSRYLETEEQRRETATWVPMPLHGVGRPEQVAELLVWLTSPANELVTGQAIFIDGGFDAVTRGDDAW